MKTLGLWPSSTDKNAKDSEFNINSAITILFACYTPNS